MGFVIVIALGLYLLISIGVVAWAVSYAKKHGKSVMKWGCTAAFIMYLIPFWDWIPTVVAHKYYCSTEAGFWVYKTPDQWKKENPGVMETLVANKVSIQTLGDNENHTDTQVLNQRFHWITEKRNLISYLPIYRWQSQVVDTNNGGVVAHWVDFSSGKGRDYWKFWMNSESCPDGITNRNSLFRFVDELIKMTDTTKRNNK